MCVVSVREFVRCNVPYELSSYFSNMLSLYCMCGFLSNIQFTFEFWTKKKWNLLLVDFILNKNWRWGQAARKRAAQYRNSSEWLRVRIQLGARIECETDGHYRHVHNGDFEYDSYDGCGILFLSNIRDEASKERNSYRVHRTNLVCLNSSSNFHLQEYIAFTKEVHKDEYYLRCTYEYYWLLLKSN